MTLFLIMYDIHKRWLATVVWIGEKKRSFAGSNGTMELSLCAAYSSFYNIIGTSAFASKVQMEKLHSTFFVHGKKVQANPAHWLDRSSCCMQSCTICFYLLFGDTASRCWNYYYYYSFGMRQIITLRRKMIQKLCRACLRAMRHERYETLLMAVIKRKWPN